MPVPASSVTHLKTLLMSLHNRAVREYFKGVPHDDETPIEEWAKIDIPENSLKVACWILNNDSVAVIIMKLFLFYVIVGGAQNLQAPLYGTPVAKFKSESVSLKPQCILKFVGEPGEEDSVEPGILEAQISFRLMWDEDSITEQKIKVFAKKVYDTLCVPQFKWKKGTKICSYRDLEHGYELRLYGFSFEEGIKVIKEILKIQDHTFTEKYLNKSENEGTFPANPGTETVLGRSQQKIRRRAIGYVSFNSADFDWVKLKEPIRLVGSPGNNRYLSPRLLYK